MSIPKNFHEMVSLSRFRAILKALHLGGLAVAILLLAGYCPTAANAPPPERILSFDSRITLNSDASMRVTETIRVRSTGEQIRRGIFRDFPTTYTDRAGHRYTVDSTFRRSCATASPKSGTPSVSPTAYASTWDARTTCSPPASIPTP